MPFDLNEEYLSVFLRLKEGLIYTLVMQAWDWGLLFEVMCNVRNFALGAVLGHRKYNKLYTIYYVS